MSHFQNQSDNTPSTQTAEYGDLIATDEKGNPVHVQTGGIADYREGEWPKGGVYHHPDQKQHHTLGVLLHRSGSSSSSSSSEDDSYGGRRKKKGMKEKIKEKLPGEDKDEHQSSTTAADHGHHEKKGVLHKIKEKLPGHHH